MVEAFYRAVTWGLLGVFASFFAYGFVVVVYTLFRFYKTELTKLFGGTVGKSPR
jgi:hypothetical protein